MLKGVDELKKELEVTKKQWKWAWFEGEGVGCQERGIRENGRGMGWLEGSAWWKN